MTARLYEIRIPDPALGPDDRGFDLTVLPVRAFTRETVEILVLKKYGRLDGVIIDDKGPSLAGRDNVLFDLTRPVKK